MAWGKHKSRMGARQVNNIQKMYNSRGNSTCIEIRFIFCASEYNYTERSRIQLCCTKPNVPLTLGAGHQSVPRVLRMSHFFYVKQNLEQPLMSNAVIFGDQVKCSKILYCLIKNSIVHDWILKDIQTDTYIKTIIILLKSMYLWRIFYRSIQTSSWCSKKQSVENPSAFRSEYRKGIRYSNSYDSWIFRLAGS